MAPLIIKDQFGIIRNLHMSPIPQTSFLVWTFFCRFLQQTGSNKDTFQAAIVASIHDFQKYFVPLLKFGPR